MEPILKVADLAKAFPRRQGDFSPSIMRALRVQPGEIPRHRGRIRLNESTIARLITRQIPVPPAGRSSSTGKDIPRLRRI